MLAARRVAGIEARMPNTSTNANTATTSMLFTNIGYAVDPKAPDTPMNPNFNCAK